MVPGILFMFYIILSTGFLLLLFSQCVLYAAIKYFFLSIQVEETITTNWGQGLTFNSEVKIGSRWISWGIQSREGNLDSLH